LNIHIKLKNNLILKKNATLSSSLEERRQERRHANPEKERKETKNGSMRLRYRHVPP
jgi:hypothetical protein